jgi:dTDP-4-amino-4,6-dideoxygalactose transaminase
VWGEEERQALTSVLESGKWWYGERVRTFEQEFAAYQDARYGVTTTNGTTSLETALLALGIGAGDEVIVPPYTFLATASAVLRVNAIPVFADILPRTLCIDPDDVAAKITSRTRAIIPVHVGGYVADMDRLRPLAQQHDLVIIEDACHSWGSAWKGKGTGALGACGVFSFQASKNISSAEGGIILTDDEALAERCRSFTNCGRLKGKAWYEHYLLGSNLRLTEFQGALLSAQLTRLPEQNARRARNAALLDEGLKDVAAITIMQPEPRMSRRAYHFYPFRLDIAGLKISKERFGDALRAEGVPNSIGYDRPLYANPLFQERPRKGPDGCPLSCPYHTGTVDYTTVHCPVCEAVVADTLWIFHTALLAEEAAMAAIVSAIKKVVDNVAELRS